MRNAIIALLHLVLAATPAAAQQAVYTNVVDGQRVGRIVKVQRETQRAAPVPPSITTTEVLPRNYKGPLGPTAYVPPVRSNWGRTRVERPEVPPQPSFVNGIYAGPSPSGNWMSTSIGRPVVDVNIISRPPRKR
jgi:hypothetical protein